MEDIKIYDYPAGYEKAKTLLEGVNEEDKDAFMAELVGTFLGN